MIKTSSGKRTDFSPKFEKKLEKAPTEIKIAFADALELFLEDTHIETLRNHALKTNYAGIRSINVTDDWRACIEKNGRELSLLTSGHTNSCMDRDSGQARMTKEK